MSTEKLQIDQKILKRVKAAYNLDTDTNLYSHLEKKKFL